MLYNYKSNQQAKKQTNKLTEENKY